MELLREAELLGTYPVKWFRWENGLEALLVENSISPVAAYLTHYTVGSAQEGDGERGLAHFFEHMMFRETDTLRDGDFDRIVAEAGGVGLNAYTSYDTTAYHVNVPVEHLERVISLESERMTRLKLSPELIERERGAVLGEMNMYKDMPSEQLWNLLMSAAFSAHPYRHPIIGYTDQVEGFQEEDFASFYKSHYAPNRAVIVVAGGFEEARVLQLLDDAYGGLAPGRPRTAGVAADPAPAEVKRLEITHDKITSEFLTIATHTPGLGHEDIPGLQFLSALLSAGHSAPLYRRLVLEGCATSVSTSLLDVDWMLASPGLFLFEVALRHGVKAEVAETAIDEVLEEFRAGGIPPAEFERALNQLRLAHFSSLRTNMSLARYLGGFTVACGDPLYGEQLLANIEQLTPGRAQALLESYFIEAPRVVVAQRPGPKEQR